MIAWPKNVTRLSLEGKTDTILICSADAFSHSPSGQKYHESKQALYSLNVLKRVQFLDLDFTDEIQKRRFFFIKKTTQIFMHIF